MKKPVVRKLTNKKLMFSALQAIRDLGYTVTDDVCGNSYFVFDGENDSICHFKIKEIPRVFICVLVNK